MSLRRPPTSCCLCPIAIDRCVTSHCPCYASNQRCSKVCETYFATNTTDDDHCEATGSSSFLLDHQLPQPQRADICLNRPPVSCSCLRRRQAAVVDRDDLLNGVATPPYATDKSLRGVNVDRLSVTSRDQSEASCDLSITELDLKQLGDETPETETALAVQSSTKSSKKDTKKRATSAGQKDDDDSQLTACHGRSCDCAKFKERCTEECKCKGDCTNSTGASEAAIPVLSPVGERPIISCKCKGNKTSSCLKDEKCPCRQLLNYCSKSCKCSAQCSNGARAAGRMSKSAKLCLISPDQSGSLCFVRIASEIYDYQFHYCSTDKSLAAQALSSGDRHVEELAYDKLIAVLNHYRMPIRRLSIYLSKSPCYHQYCRPECGVLQTCYENIACARMLAVLARQVRRRLKDNSLEIAVKILMVDGTRGDLYTSRAVTTLLKAGINVEPLGIKEWSQFVFDKQPIRALDCAERRGLPLQIPTTPNEELDENFYNQAKNTWSVCQMDGYLLQTQQYINKSRVQLGLKKSYWSSRLHELLKYSLRSTYDARQRFDQLNGRLEKLTHRRHHFRSNMTLASSTLLLRRTPPPPLLLGSERFSRRAVATVIPSTATTVESSPPPPPPASCDRLALLLGENFDDVEPKMVDEAPAAASPSSSKTAGAGGQKKLPVRRSNTGPLIAISKQLSIFRQKAPESDQSAAAYEQQSGSSSAAAKKDDRLKLKSAVSLQNMTSTAAAAQRDTSRDAEQAAKEQLERLIWAVASRNITEEEKSDIIREIVDAVDDIRGRLEAFMDLLELRITSTSL